MTKLLRPITMPGSRGPLRILDPKTKGVVPAEGVHVDDNDPFWRRRLRDGSMEIVEESPLASAPSNPIHVMTGRVLLGTGEPHQPSAGAGARGVTSDSRSKKEN